jgi:hypothetical protein
MAKPSKAHADALGRLDKETLYAPREALEFARNLAHAKFDEGIDAAFQLGIDARKADQLVRGTVPPPAHPLQPSPRGASREDWIGWGRKNARAVDAAGIDCARMRALDSPLWRARNNARRRHR